MHIYYWLLLLFSALLNSVNVVWVDWFWWTPFVSIIPFLYASYFVTIPYYACYIWAFCSNTIHLYGIIMGTQRFTTSPWYYNAFVGCIIIAYSALFGLVIRAVVDIFKKIATLYDKRHNITYNFSFLPAWAAGLWLYFTLMNGWSLAPFGIAEGYFSFNPLLTLVQHPFLLHSLPRLGIYSLLLILLIGQLFIVELFLIYMVHDYKRHPILRRYTKVSLSKINMFFLLSSIIFIWFLSIVLPQKSIPAPQWLERIIAVPTFFERTIVLNKTAQQAQNVLKSIAKKYPTKDIILMPEAAFYCEHIHEPNICAYWNAQQIGKPLHLIFGAFRWENNLYRNSAYWLYNGKVKDVFDKRHAMVLIERIPALCKCNLIHNLYFKESPEIIPSDNPRPTWQIDDMCLVPYLCSELFFMKKTDAPKNCTLVALCNDRWADAHVQKLMCMLAQYKAIVWQRPIIYVSFSYNAYINIQGIATPLTTYTNHAGSGSSTRSNTR